MDSLEITSDGRLVCAEHGLGSCSRCCMIFDNMGFEVFEANFQQQVGEDNNPDRVLVLEPGENRFIPQWDAQLLGFDNTTRLRMNYDSPPKPEALQASALLICSRCELTWLTGKAGQDAAGSHPSHHTLLQPYSGTMRRSLVVHTDGACINNGRQYAAAGIGVFFAPHSRYNISTRLRPEFLPTNQAAELHAILGAMQVVRKNIVPERSMLVRSDVDLQHFRLIVVTDSSYVVECMCRHWKYWFLDHQQRVLRNQQGKEIVNSKVLLAIEAEVARLSRVGVQVVYYHIRRELNGHADALARAGVSR